MTGDRAFSEEIVSENMTDELVVSYTEQGFSLFFVEEIMRFDLALVLPDQHSLPVVKYQIWNAQNAGAFFSVYTAAFQERPGFPGWSAEKWIEMNAGDPLFRPDLSFLALVEDRVAGFITNGGYEEAPERLGYIDQIGVEPAWRGRRVGEALLTQALQAWHSDGKEAVILHVNINNPGAIRLYQRLGFETIGRRGKFRR